MWWLTALVLAADGGSAGTNLLAGAQLRVDTGVQRSAVVRDGQLPFEGDFWDTDWSAKMEPTGRLEWDLGEPKAIAAAFVQGDNNDLYVLSGSMDGQTFTTFWKSDIDPLPGMRTRVATGLNVTARYVRLTAEGGDRMYSIGELQLFSDAAAMNLASLPRKPRPPPPDPKFDASWLVVLAVAGAFVWFFNERLRESRANKAAAAPTDESSPPSA